MLERQFKQEVERFLIDYGIAFKEVDRIDELRNGGRDRVKAFENLHKAGIKRVKSIVAEFGKS